MYVNGRHCFLPLTLSVIVVMYVFTYTCLQMCVRTATVYAIIVNLFANEQQLRTAGLFVSSIATLHTVLRCLSIYPRPPVVHELLSPFGLFSVNAASNQRCMAVSAATDNSFVEKCYRDVTATLLRVTDQVNMLLRWFLNFSQYVDVITIEKMLIVLWYWLIDDVLLFLCA